MNPSKTIFFTFLALGILILFALPLKFGIKIDPAIYSAMARDVAQGLHVWPLNLPVMFPEFYEHPPLTIWIMGIFMKLFGESYLVAAIYSRLCALGCFILVILYSRKIASRREEFSIGELDNVSILSGLLLLSWIPWVKYSGAAQLEGPLSLAILATYLFMLESNRKDSSLSFGTLTSFGFLLGVFGFGSKGVIFFSISFACLTWSLLISKNKKSIVSAVSIVLGWFTGAALMLGLDKVSGTTWSKYYWSRALGWGLQGTNQYSASGQTSWLDLGSRALSTLSTEIRMSPIWTSVLWIVMIYAVFSQIKKRTLMKPSLTLAFIFYWAFLVPFMIAKTKMPHWPVPIYPVMVLFLIGMSPNFVFAAKPWPIIKKYLVPSMMLVSVLLAIVPYAQESSWGRGEEWIYHKQALKNHINNDKPLIVVKENLPMFMVYGYSHWFWGREMPRAYTTLDSIKSRECQSGTFLWIADKLAKANAATLKEKNWLPVMHQHKNITLLSCQNNH